MSAFNILCFSSECPNCKKLGRFSAQFKYGDTWQHRYEIGDMLKWGGNDIGLRAAKLVRVEAIADPCEHCGTDNLEFDIVIESGVVARVEPVGVTRTDPLPDGFQIMG
jgi:hypothetical protein